MPSQYEKVLIMGRRVKHIIEKAGLSTHLSGKKPGPSPPHALSSDNHNKGEFALSGYSALLQRTAQ
jgi:hypothetical protein